MLHFSFCWKHYEMGWDFCFVICLCFYLSLFNKYIQVNVGHSEHIVVCCLQFCLCVSTYLCSNKAVRRAGQTGRLHWGRYIWEKENETNSDVESVAVFFFFSGEETKTVYNTSLALFELSHQKCPQQSWKGLWYKLNVRLVDLRSDYF